MSESHESLNAYLEEWVFGVADRDDYWEKLGPEVLERLKVPANSGCAGELWSVLKWNTPLLN